MATTSILKLKVESEEYDQKLKRAAEGIRHLADYAHRGDGALMGLDKAEIAYIKSLGDMETKSRSAAGRLRELESAFKELTVVYNELSAEEKSDEGGKALVASLATIKERAVDARKQMEEATKTLNDNGQAAQQSGSVLDQLTSKFTINVDAIKLFNAGLSVAKGALDVAKDAFFASEDKVDEWGRTMQSAQSVYAAFLNDLNTGDISGFLTRIDDIVSAARKAYDEMDRFGTIKTIQGPAVSAQQTENERMRMMIQTVRYIAPIDGRAAAPGMKNGDLLTPAQIRTIEKHLQSGMQTVVKLVGNEVKQSSKAIGAYYDSLAKQNGMTMAEFRKGTSSMAEFDKRLEGAKRYEEFEAAHTTYKLTFMGNGEYENRAYRDDAVNPFAEFKNWGIFRVDKMGENSLNELVQFIKQRDQQAGQAYSMQAQAYRAINRAEGITVRNIMGGGSHGGKGSTKTPQDKAGDIVSKAEAEYAATLDKIAVRREAGLDTALQAKQKEVAATEKLYDAYTTAYNTYADPTYKDMAAFTASMLGALAGKVNEAKDAQDAEKQAAQQLAKTEKKKAHEMEQQKLMGNFSESGISAGISYLKGKKAEAVIGSAEYKNFDTQLTDATTMGTLTGVMDKYNITPDQINVDAAGIWQKIINGNDIANADWQGVADAINEKLSEMGIKPIKLDVQTGGLKSVAKDVDVLASTTKNAGSAMTQLGGALAGLEDPSAKVAGIVMQAIGNVALSFSQAMATPKDPWSWIAFAVAGTATMISTIAAIHSATGYAEGGVIPGNSFSGDNQLARVNAGELILSKSAQANLANQLENPATPGGGSDRTPYLRGQDIFLGLNNYLRSSGRGQLVTSRC